EELHQRLTKVFETLGQSYEILFVNDGSTDGSAAVLDALHEQDEHVGVIHFRTNFGKAAALDAGFNAARGARIITLDADLQDDPKEIPRLLAALDQGFDLVSGWKKVRHDPWHKTIPSRLFNSVVRRFSGLPLHDFNCGFKAYNAEALEDLTLYGELHRYIPVLVAFRGFKVTELDVEHHPRKHGASKYGIERFAKGFFDLLTVVLNTRYRSRPLHLFGLLGLGLGTCGGLILTALTASWFAGYPLSNRPLLFLGLLLVMVGVQLVSTGLIGEMIARSQSEGKPSYMVRDERLAKVTVTERRAFSDASEPRTRAPAR
ncbi:MAG: glycosyltransferase family 2 protein, partial [Myxococcota bacterium]